MGQIIELKDGTEETVMRLEDMLDLIEDHMGSDFRYALEDYYSEKYEDTEELEQIIKENETVIELLGESHKKIMAELSDEVSKLSGLIQVKDLDRGAISNTLGAISGITWKLPSPRCPAIVPIRSYFFIISSIFGSSSSILSSGTIKSSIYGAVCLSFTF